MKTNPKLNSCWLFCMVGIFAFTLSAQAASFDCAKANTKVEHMICDNPEVSILDEKLGQDYQHAITKAAENQKQTIIAEQKAWLRERDRCSDAACLEAAYEKRLVSLGMLSSRPYMLVMSKDSSLCRSMLDLYNSDMASSGQINYDEHEIFSKISWQYDDDLDLEHASFDINNDGQNELVVKKTWTRNIEVADSLYVFPSDSDVLSKLSSGKGGMKVLFDDPNVMFSTKNILYHLKSIPDQVAESIVKFKLGALPPYLQNVNPHDLRRDLQLQSVGSSYVLEPFLWNGTFFISITERNPEWIVIGKYKQGEEVQDICYFYDQSHQFVNF